MFGGVTNLPSSEESVLRPELHSRVEFPAKMNPRLLACVVLVSLLYVTPFNCQPVLLPNYKISLYNNSLRLSTALWLLPAYCLYEEWLFNTVDPSVAVKQKSSILVQVQIPGDNNTYIVPGDYEVPQCRPIFNPLQATEPFVYQVGPNIELANGSSVQTVLPSRSYRHSSSSSGHESLAARPLWGNGGYYCPPQHIHVLPAGRTCSRPRG
ncbi:hypothetical protein XENTR_v10019343 [Xenopus tropicalis]|nr:hypothetical protein XENTR_v10019343 [Xenopus tropicalis]